MNFKIVSYILGWVLKLEAIFMVIPMLIAFFLHEGTWPAFLIAIIVALIPGLLLSKKELKTGNFFIREGYAATALSWLVMSLIGALPFFLSHRIPNYIDAFFEIISGFTTTGSSILADVEALGKGLLFWRSFSHWLGGMGVLVLLLAILPMNGGYHMQFMKAESPGPSVSKLVPRTSDTAKVLYTIYILMTALMVGTYLISGMPFYDALCIGFGTAGTGGFAVRNSGMGDYGTVSQILITIWMILFGVNFNIWYLVIRGKGKDALKSEEVRVYLGYIATVILIIFLLVRFNTYPDKSAGYSLHHSAFTVASIISTTGFSTVDFDAWPELAKVLLLVTMILGACAGSTGGGMKVSRIILLMKQGFRELKIFFHPQSVSVVHFDQKPVEHTEIRSVNDFLIFYILVALGSLLLISIDGFDLETNVSAVLATLNNIGPGLGKVGPTLNYSNYSSFSKLVLSFDMLAGRLELLPMLLLFYPRTWTKHH